MSTKKMSNSMYERITNINPNIESFYKKFNLQPLKEWELCKENLKQYIPEPFYTSFIEPLFGFYDYNHNIILYADNEKLQNHIEIRYKNLLEDILYYFYKDKLQINSIKFFNRNQENTNISNEVFKVPIQLIHHSNIYQDNISNLWRYDLFYPSKKNYSELTNLIKLEKYFRPIFIYGPPGSGKTSLAKIWIQNHKNTVYYNTIPEFINQFILALKKRQLIDWIEKIKSYSIFLLDDFQMLKTSAKKTQEELRNLIDYYHEKNKIFVLFSDRDFFSMELQEDLKSRLMAFYTIHLSYPDFETKKEIIRHYINKYNINLDEKVIEHISLKLNGDVRYIKSSIEKLAYYSINPEKLKLNEIDYILEPFYEKSNLITMEQIVNVVCEHYRISKEEIFSNKKEKKIAFPRHLIAYLSVKIGNYTLTNVAKFLHKKDHTSVLYAIKKIEEVLSKDLFLQNEIEILKEKLYSKLTNH